jgi:hypothetical protein
MPEAAPMAPPEIAAARERGVSQRYLSRLNVPVRC